MRCAVLGRWHPPEASYQHSGLRLDVAESLHSTQVRLLWQGLHLLQSGGRLVYSTCSFNPIENEAVVAAVLRRLSEHGLRDVVQLEKPQTLHGFHARQGLTSWLTSDGDGAGESMRPPASSEEDWLAPELRKCIRLQPQLDDCGGFFVAVFRRASAAPLGSDRPRRRRYARARGIWLCQRQRSGVGEPIDTARRKTVSECPISKSSLARPTSGERSATFIRSTRASSMGICSSGRQARDAPREALPRQQRCRSSSATTGKSWLGQSAARSVSTAGYMHLA